MARRPHKPKSFTGREGSTPFPAIAPVAPIGQSVPLIRKRLLVQIQPGVPIGFSSACSAAWLARLDGVQKVAGSNPVAPINAGVVQW